MKIQALAMLAILYGTAGAGRAATAENSGPPCCAAGGVRMTVVRGPAAASRATANATIVEFAFTSNVIVNVGDTVTWTNMGAESHTVTSDTGLFDAGALEHGSTFSFTFTAAGDFPYHCEIHPRMKAQVRAVAPGTVAINSELTAIGTSGAPFTYTISSLGAAPLAFTAANLPPGLTLSGATISGTPTTAGTTTVALTASNSAGSDAQTLTVLIQAGTGAPLAPSITSPLIVTGKAGQPFSYTITADNSPKTFGATGLPSGLTISAGQISGVPAGDGTFAVTLLAANAAGTASQTLNLTVLPVTSSNSGIDANGNGVPDEFEIAIAGSAVPAAQPLAVKTLTIGLKFSSSDAVTLSGTLPGAGRTSGASVAFDIGGIVRTFTLDAKGNATSGADRLKVSPKTGAFTLKLKGSVAAQLADEGLTQTKVKKLGVTVPVYALAGGQVYAAGVKLSYSSQGKTGMARE